MLYLLLVYTIPVSEFLDVVPNSDVSKSVTSKVLTEETSWGRQFHLCLSHRITALLEGVVTVTSKCSF